MYKKTQVSVRVILSCVLFLVSWLSIALAAKSSDESTTNIILILVDDMGYADLGVFGSKTNSTPNLDQMANEGQIWTDFYSTSSVCSPTRGAIMTGMYPVRSGLYGKRLVVAFPNDSLSIPKQVVTLPEYLKQQGYVTALLGKWHLGDSEEAYPTQHGFDYWYGIPYSNDMQWTKARRFPEFLRLYMSQQPELIQEELMLRQKQLFSPKSEYWEVPLIESQKQQDRAETKVLQKSVQQSEMTKQTTSSAIRFIKQHSDSPFFVQLSYAMPHVPLFTSSSFKNKTGKGIYADVIAELDFEIGRLKKHLVDNGLAQNTLLIFTSDNGPWLMMQDHAGDAGAFKQGKGTTFEGGMRVPTFFWQPGVIKPGKVSALGTSLDLFSTLANFANGKTMQPMADIATDSVDLSPVLRGQAEQTRQELAFYHQGELRAYRMGDYKAHFITQGAYNSPPKRSEHTTPLLFDLKQDPSESTDIAKNAPTILSKLLAKKAAHESGMQVATPLFDKRLSNAMSK